MKFASSRTQTTRSISGVASIITVLIITFGFSIARGQVVSHELRRLAVSTNQFGLDALKALDRIEPPDKVLVFCPVCLSSSLMMIMMGSSKYQVVSSFRHALYVWSMKPNEINQAFRDIFDHIGLNQQQQHHKQLPKSRQSSRAQIYSLAFNDSKVQAPTDNSELVSNLPGKYLSLPKLMRMKELLDSSSREQPWWLAHNKKKAANDSNDLEKRPDSSQMSAISNIYIQRGIAMNYNYNLLLRQHYKTVIHPVDFIRNGEETRQHINSLVAANTEGKIKDLVKKGTFDRKMSPRIMIITTFHFRGTLDIQMKNQNPEPKQQKSSKQQVFIQTEESRLKYGYFADIGCSVVEIPFSNRLVSLIIVMPNHSNMTDLMLTKLNALVLSDMISSLSVKKISIEIPVIKFDRGPINVEGLTRELGLDAYFFGDVSTFSKTSETGLNKWMRPSDIVHETSIDIGTINPNWIQTEDRLKVGAHEDRSKVGTNDERSKMNNHIKLDKPFFYFVFDSINSLFLTMGRIRQ